MGWDSAVGIVTSYGMDGSGIEFRWGQDFPQSSRFALGPTQRPTLDTGPFPGVKRSRRGVYHPPPFSTKVKERVELYFYSPSGPSLFALGELYFRLFKCCCVLQTQQHTEIRSVSKFMYLYLPLPCV